MYANDAPWNDPDPDDTEPMKQKFISWKGWKTTLGRNNLWILLAGQLLWVGLWFGGHWILKVLAVVFTAAMWIASVINWRALLKIDPSRKDGHTVELWDAAPYTCMHGVKPDHITKECAYPFAHDTEFWQKPTPEERKIRIQT